jgi:hypothetical protein
MSPKTPTTTRSERRRSASVAKRKRRSVANIRNTTAARRARAQALSATRVATVRSSGTVKRRLDMEDARNKRGMDLDVSNTAAKLQATADSNRSMALTLIALVDMVVVVKRRLLDMVVVVARKNHPATDASKSTFRNLAITASKAMDARSHVRNLLTVTVLTHTTAPVPDMAAKSALSMVVSGPISRMVRRACRAALKRSRLRDMVVRGGGRMRMSMGGLLGGRRVEVDMGMRGMLGGTRRDVSSTLMTWVLVLSAWAG